MMDGEHSEWASAESGNHSTHLRDNSNVLLIVQLFEVSERVSNFMPAVQHKQGHFSDIAAGSLKQP